MPQNRERRIAALCSFVVRLAPIALLVLIVPVTPSLAQAAGHVRLKITKASLFVGGGVGSGILTYGGRDYPFRISGLSLGVAAGASVSRLEGLAIGIRHVADFAGTYDSVGGGGAFVGGFGGVQLRNEKGRKDRPARAPRRNRVCRQPQPDHDFPEEVTMQSIDFLLCRAGDVGDQRRLGPSGPQPGRHVRSHRTS